jgi:predicted O-linked N-acetylglucosamine transferase (SPINDLY family)
MDRRNALDELHLPEDAFVFCSFNQTYKIDPLIFDSWMKILKQVQDSVLWLFKGEETACKNLRTEARARDVAADRLIFAEKLSKSDHLSRYRLTGLTLDTRMINGHTTTSDALWAGVPVVTLQGTHFASRVTSSLLKAVDLPELITHDIATMNCWRFDWRITRGSSLQFGSD